MPLPRGSQPAAREARAVHTADIHISEPNGTDIWIDVRIDMASLTAVSQGIGTCGAGKTQGIWARTIQPELSI